MNEQQHKPELSSENQWINQLAGTVWWWAKRIVFAVLMLFLLVYLLLQIPFFQTWAAQRVTNFLSKELHTTVQIDRLSVAFFDQLVLEEFYVEDLKGDTLMYSHALKANFNTNLLKLLRGSLEIDELSLENTRFNLRRAAGEETNNFQFILDYFQRDTSIMEPESRVKKPFYLNIKELYLTDVAFENTDELRGKRLYTYMRRGVVILNELNLPDKKIDVEIAELESPVVEVNENPRDSVALAAFWERYAAQEKRNPDTSLFDIQVEEFLLHNGTFQFHNYRRVPEKQTPEEILDYSHMEVFNINIDVEDFKYDGDVFTGRMEHMDLADQSGFVLNKLSSEEVIVSSEQTRLNGLRIVTPYTDIGDTLVFEYNEWQDWSDFNNNVEMDVRLNNAKIAVSDIMVFAPPLEDNEFFQNNADKVLRANGIVRGEVNNLRAREFSLRLNGNTMARGNFSSRNLAVRNEEFLNLRLDRLLTNMATLRQLFPNMNLPANFDRLGRLDFEGRFDGFFIDFVADGSLKTDIGAADMDMRMNLKPGRQDAEYSGQISLTEFDLATWTGNPDFGAITLKSAVQNGRGLSGASANAQLTANIERFVFRGYEYKNAMMEGELKQKFFNGDFEIQDNNIDFTFQGQVDYSDSIPVFDFSANINTLALQPLNLSKKDLVLAGDVEMRLRDDKLSTLEGRAEACEFVIEERGKTTHEIDSVVLTSRFNEQGQKSFRIESDLMQVAIDGQFDIEAIPNALLQFAHRNYAGFAEKLQLKNPTQQLDSSRFTFDIELTTTKGLTELFAPELDTLSNITLTGDFDSYQDSIYFEIDIPKLRYDEIEITGGYVKSNFFQQQGEMNLILRQTLVGENTDLAPVYLQTYFNKDSLIFGLTYAARSGQTQVLDQLNLDGTYVLLDSVRSEIRFDNSDLTLMQSRWNINEDNRILLGDRQIEVTDFDLTDNKGRRIILDNVGRRGLDLSLQDFDFNFIDTYWDYDALDFGGHFNLKTQIKDVFRMTGLSTEVNADTFFVNNDDFGGLRLLASAQSLSEKFDASLAITKGTTRLLADGHYQPASKEETEKLQEDFFDFDITLNRYPLEIVEYFIGDAVSNTVGHVDAEVRLHGAPTAPDIDGQAIIQQGAITIDYLNTRYFIDDQRVDISSAMFDASGSFITDRFGNRADVRGGIVHNHLRDFALDAQLKTDRLLGLDTQKGDNDLFYGVALGSGTVTFTGPFDRANIDVQGATGAGTRLVIPVDYGQDVSEVRFINFKDPREEKARSFSTEIRGLRLTMDIIATDEAEMRIIFDEQAGDIMRGRGNGNIQIYLSRAGEITMYGDYEIEQGEYLFTLLNLVNKPFTVKQGGTIRWTGDPLNAQLNLVAEYKGLSTSLSNFIQEYLSLADADVRTEASQPTDVELTMRLQGELIRPIINFNLAFPEVQGVLKTYTDSKLRTLMQDQNELNRQVFGLIVVGQFLPSSFNLQGSDLTINTVSELVANQLSILFTEFFSELVTDIDFISGVDFDISYNRYENDVNFQGSEDELSYYGNEFQLQLKNYLFNDKLSISIGGNVANGNISGSNSTFFGNDFVLEYVLTKDRSLKWRVYQTLEPSIAGGRRLQIGTGISYRKEFDTFRQLIQAMANGQN